MLSDPAHEVVLAEEENAPQDEDDHDAQGDHVQHEGVLVGQDPVDHVPDNPGQVQVPRRGEDRADERQGEHPQVGPYVR